MAHTLNVPMDIISLKPVDVLTSPQNSPSWGSWTTDGMCSSAKTACTTMKDRLQQVRPLKWYLNQYTYIIYQVVIGTVAESSDKKMNHFWALYFDYSYLFETLNSEFSFTNYLLRLP